MEPEKDDVHIAPIPKPDHAIDHLIADAGKQLDELLAKETTDVHAAAEAYRKRRGRQPPPGFDNWFAFAKEKDALVVEEFWDGMQHSGILKGEKTICESIFKGLRI